VAETAPSISAGRNYVTIGSITGGRSFNPSDGSAADWVRNNVLYATKGMPEVMVGNVLIAEVK